MQTIETRARVGKDGVLTLNVPIGAGEADREVIVTVREAEPIPMSNEEWHQFIERTAGSWQGEPLVRAPQGEYEKREELE